jgi:hypothetical protein
MKVLLAMVPFFFFASLSHAGQSLSEILTQARCVPKRSAVTGQIEKYSCTNLKSDSVQMLGIQKTAVVLSGQDEFADFEREATDLSHVNDVEQEIEIE